MNKAKAKRNWLFMASLITSPLGYLILKMDSVAEEGGECHLNSIMDRVEKMRAKDKYCADAAFMAGYIPAAMVGAAAASVCKIGFGMVTSPVVGAVAGYKNRKPKSMNGFDKKYMSTDIAEFWNFPTYEMGKGIGIGCRKMFGQKKQQGESR